MSDYEKMQLVMNELKSNPDFKEIQLVPAYECKPTNPLFTASV